MKQSCKSLRFLTFCSLVYNELLFFMFPCCVNLNTDWYHGFSANTVLINFQGSYKFKSAWNFFPYLAYKFKSAWNFFPYLAAKRHKAKRERLIDASTKSQILIGIMVMVFLPTTVFMLSWSTHISKAQLQLLICTKPSKDKEKDWKVDTCHHKVKFSKQKQTNMHQLVFIPDSVYCSAVPFCHCKSNGQQIQSFLFNLEVMENKQQLNLTSFSILLTDIHSTYSRICHPIGSCFPSAWWHSPQHNQHLAVLVSSWYKKLQGAKLLRFSWTYSR